MPSPAVLDFANLLEAIAGNNPAGEPTRDTVYDEIKEARREDDALPQGDWKRETKTADWRAVVEMATNALTTKTKDLQIAAWLAEALVKRHGFAGLRDSLQLLRELHERFWECLYPVMEDGDLDPRARTLEWLNGRLAVLIGDVPITGGEEGYSWHRWEESRRVDNLGRQTDERGRTAYAQTIAEGKITGEQFDKAMAATSRAFYEQLFDDIAQSWEQCETLIKVVDDKFQKDAPSLLAIKKALENCRSLVEPTLKKKRELDPNYKPPQNVMATPSETGPVGNASISVGTPVGNLPLEPISREDAFRRLAAIAEYLKRVEPQSPVSYLVDRAVRWSKMPLEEWLGEVVQNDDVMARLRQTLGIKAQI